MKLGIKICFLSVFLGFASINSVIILLHGTFASNSEWYRPNGKFFNVLEKSANFIGHNLVSFTWSGQNNDKARFEAAQSLSKLILSYPANEPKILVGHSHGGNVIAIASKLLYDPFSKLDSLFRYPGDKLTIDSFNSWLKACLVIHLEIQKFKLRNNFKETLDNKYLIDKAYFLATPVDCKAYLPNMLVIKNLYHFYSKGDYVQPLLGLYKRAYEGISRINNFSVIISNSSPSHSGMHDEIIAKWLLLIPQELSKAKIGGFENFDENLDGEIHVFNNEIKYFPNLNTIPKKEQKDLA